MSRRTLEITEPLYEYMLGTGTRESDLLRELRQTTAELKWARMQISPEQGQLMELLVRLTGARRAIEVGVFTGYSSLCIAAALPADGELVACDVSKEWTDIARGFWKRAGVEDRIKLHLRPALATLEELKTEQRTAPGTNPAAAFDFAFIDADKGNYRAYYEACLELLRPGGLIAVDNVLWGGSVADPSVTDEDTAAIRAFNRFVHGDERVDLSLIPIGDGLSLLRKR